MKKPAKSDLFRRLPSVDELLRAPAIAYHIERDGRAAVTDAARAVLQRLRAEISAGRLAAAGLDLAISGAADAVARELRHALSYSLRPVINATGVVLHTNLGRAPLTPAAIEHIAATATQYSNLEFDLGAGQRGKRDVHTQRLFGRLLAEAGRDTETVVVNNNAAAVLLALNTLAEGGEVVVSRGELVEIGGSFRIPDVMSKSGALLREVGTTNRTRIADYERSITDRTRLLLRVHRSNFAIVGFTEQPSLEALVALGRKRKIPVMEDLGSGALFDLRSIGVEGEPNVLDSLRAGADVVTYSGDKLLGGPQAGILSGAPDCIAKVRANPLFRALRVDKLSYAALEATLMAYLKQDLDTIPAVRMLRLTKNDLARRARELEDAVRTANPHLRTDTLEGTSLIGGGAAPGATLPTVLLAVTAEGLSADELAARLRAHHPPIITRVEEGRVLFDLRTVLPEQDAVIVAALKHLS